MTETSGSRILDRGYRPFEGPRGGRANAVRSVAVQGFRSVLGLGRPARTKILPVASAAIAYVPAIVFVGLAVLVPGGILDPNEVASYASSYGFIISALVLFTALVAPSALTSDRRNGMLGLYLSTPLTRSTYLLAKALSVGTVLLIVTLGPPLLILIGYSFEGAGPSGVLGFSGVLGRILLSGLAISAVYSGVSMAVASLTDRQAVASAAIVFVLLVSGTLTTTLVENTSAPDELQLANLVSVPFELVFRIFGENGPMPELATLGVVTANIGWALLGWGFTWWRYRTMAVAR